MMRISAILPAILVKGQVRDVQVRTSDFPEERSDKRVRYNSVFNFYRLLCKIQ